MGERAVEIAEIAEPAKGQEPQTPLARGDMHAQVQDAYSSWLLYTESIELGALAVGAVAVG